MDSAHTSKQQTDTPRKAALKPGEQGAGTEDLSPTLPLLTPENAVRFNHTIGNQAVQRLLTTTSSAVHRQIQRAPPTAVREFIPHFTVSPNVSLIRLFDHFEQVFKIDNRRKAPANTSFFWGYGIDANGTLRILSDSETDQGASRHVQLQARKPGNTKIQATPVYQVPGGPELTGAVQSADVTVDPPTLQLLSLMYRKADGGGIPNGRLSVGDKCIARVKVGNVAGKYLEDPSIAAVTGGGLDVMTPTTPKPVQRFGDGGSYDVEFTATRVGSFNLQLELGLGEIALGTGPKATGITGDVEYSRADFLGLLGQCHVKIDQAYTNANSIMEVVSAAYGNAYDAHVKTLEAQSASNRLAEEILLGAALAFIPGGVGGVVGGFMKSAQAGDFLGDAVKDLAKAGLRGVENAAVQAGGGAGGSGGALRPMATDPRTWRADEAVHVNSEKQKVLTDLDGWYTKFNSSDPNFYLNFNPVSTMDAALTRGGLQLATLPVPDQQEHQKKFELGFWKEWLQNFGYGIEFHAGRYGGGSYGTTENQGKKIRDRINALGENGDQWLEMYGGISKAKAEAEAAAKNKQMGGF